MESTPKEITQKLDEKLSDDKKCGLKTTYVSQKIQCSIDLTIVDHGVRVEPYV